ncbi:hypothetical protein [Ramlibacter humi]|uniref:Uncharacterized protein n=1 Tax=Ramlibacter humi TaxID=2530451 RepID=A0A4Z0C9A2_9BURK|nr:hypothetical protein [Ramlibacter humi]TFZ08193.1 hypothetical protein EZ216_03250 [Ramlibacter humi]
MLFKFFKRAEPPAPAARPRPVRSARPAAAPAIHEPPPMPEVKEDHDESAWDLWEQSQFQLDSQLGPLSAADSVKVNDTAPKKGNADDAYSRIGKNHR